MVLLFIFSFTDPRKCKLYINHIHVATNEEIVSKMDESFWGVPWTGTSAFRHTVSPLGEVVGMLYGPSRLG